MCHVIAIKNILTAVGNKSRNKGATQPSGADVEINIPFRFFLFLKFRPPGLLFVFPPRVELCFHFIPAIGMTGIMRL